MKALLDFARRMAIWVWVTPAAVLGVTIMELEQLGRDWRARP